LEKEAEKAIKEKWNKKAAWDDVPVDVRKLSGDYLKLMT
jgi:hypothetical protein